MSSSHLDRAFAVRNGTAVASTTFGGRVVVWSTKLAGPLPALQRLADNRATNQLTRAERKAYL